MKTFHVNLRVENIENSVDFYNSVFNQAPTVEKPDYAKWKLDNPRVNFSVSLGSQKGLGHLGIEAETEEEFGEVQNYFERTKQDQYNQGHTVCCYARSEKSWIQDPAGIEWELFRTYGESEINKVENEACCDENCCAA